MRMCPAIFRFLTLVCSIASVALGQTLTSPVVLAGNSPVVGSVESTVDGLQVHQFLGIPFGEAPVGAKRFQPPEEKQPWSNTFQATTQGAICYQVTARLQFLETLEGWVHTQNYTPSEDCLSLDVFVPQNSGPESEDKLAVMVFFHGGGFVLGSGHQPVYDGKVMAALGNVIVVTVNYRLNVFGFLCNGGPEAPGNLGILDQQLALKWVRRNIGRFGGDKNRVTIFGQSAGGCTSNYHLALESSRPYFKRAIMQSGVASIPSCSNSLAYAQNLTIKMGLKVNCTADNLSSIVECLKLVPAQTLINNLPTGLGFLQFGWAPVYGGDFIPDDPYVTIEERDLKKADLLIGSVETEAAFFVQTGWFSVFGNLSNPDPIPTVEEFRYYVNLTIGKQYGQGVNYDQILQHYDPALVPDESELKNMTYSQALIRMISDMYITCDAQRLALKAYDPEDDEHRIFNYIISYQIPPHANWAAMQHVGELSFLFGSTFADSANYSDEQRAFTRKLIKMWTNFAKTGSPTSPESPSFPPFSANHKPYLSINLLSDQVGENFRDETCSFLHALRAVYYP